MTVNLAASSKSVSNDDYLEMTTAIFSSRVTGMQVTLVFDEQLVWREGVGEYCLYFGGAATRHGNTRLNGLTVTLPYTPAAM